MINRAWFIVLTVLLVQACAAPGGGGAAGPQESASASVYTPQAGLSQKERFRQGLHLLAEGDPVAARAELVLYLEQQPNSETGRDLLDQIDLPASEYFPPEYREVQLDIGVSLSNLSQQYLGSIYQFYALAKYNGIAEPRKLTVGQTLRIPLTETAHQAFAIQDGQQEAIGGNATPSGEMGETVPVQPVVIDEPESEGVQGGPDQQAAQVDQLHREALNAYRAQDLDRAIELWGQVLALQPDYENARLYLSQAEELKKKLSSLN